MGVMRHGKPDKSIGDYISLFFSIKEIHPKLLWATKVGPGFST